MDLEWLGLQVIYLDLYENNNVREGPGAKRNEQEKANERSRIEGSKVESQSKVESLFLYQLSLFFLSFL